MSESANIQASVRISSDEMEAFLKTHKYWYEIQ